MLLTDTPGLFTADPRSDSSAELISEVLAEDPLLTVAAGATRSDRGSGGMASKLAAAKMASWSGTRAVIAAADQPDVLVDAAAGAMVGTTFQPERASARGAQAVDRFRQSGRRCRQRRRRRPARAWSSVARRCCRPVSPAIIGNFDEGDVVEVRDASNGLVARGMVLSDAATLRAIIGKRTGDLPSHIAHEVIHRDDLVLLT